MAADNKMLTPFGALVGLVILGGLAWLAFGFLGIQSAFLDSEVDQAAPTFGQERTQEELETLLESDEFREAMLDAEGNPTEANQSVGDTAMAGDIITQFSGGFAGIMGYDITGEALVLNDGSAQRFLRFENFSSDNGPDLKVVLRAENGDLVNLGPLQGNIGDQNYEIPADVDLDVFSFVEIYCERFSVLFGGAQLSPVAT